MIDTTANLWNTYGLNVLAIYSKEQAVSDEFNNRREFSGRFQIRINPDLHKRLFNLSSGMNCSINDAIELAADFAMKDWDFMSYLDDYLLGAIMIVDNRMPIAHLVRRNVISFSYIDPKQISVDIKVKRGSVWRQAKVIANLEQNPTLIDRFKKWSITH